MIKKADIILAVILLITGFTMSYVLSFGQSAGSELLVTCEGEKFASYSLLENREVVIEQNGHTNKFTIEQGTVSMVYSDCHGQDCIHQGSISQTGENIICLPNKVVLEITGNDDVYDTIAR